MSGRILRIGAALLMGGAALVVPGAVAPVRAETPALQLIGLAGGRLLHFSSASPGTIDANIPITGVLAGDALHSIDVRPATGQLFGLAINTALPRTSRLYVIDPTSGAATPVGKTSTTVPGAGTRVSMDFNPTVDRVRVVDSGDENLRLNPNNAVLSGDDTNLTPAIANVGGIAYDRNTAARTAPSATPTTLYAIRANGSLAMIGGPNGAPSPNGGVLTQVGPLGLVPTSNAIGFDVSPQGVALASIKVGASENLYSVNLASGAATLVGAIGTGALGVTDLALLDVGVPAGASQYVGVESYRLVDTRESGKVVAGGVLTVPVTNRGPIPATGVSAAVLNVTVTQPDAPGYTTVWPSGTPMTNTSSVNVDDGGQTRAALVTVPVGADGAVKIFSERGSHLIVDVVGYFTPVVDPGGRLFTVTPSRLLDTRTGVGLADGVATKPGDGATVELIVAGRGGVPASGATAVVVNVTMTATDAPGYVTAFAGDVVQPLASNLNASAAGDTIANLAIVPVGATGTIKLFTERGTHLIVDVVGFFGPDAFVTPRGLFVPVSPDRILDTRTGLGAQPGVIGPGWSVNATVAGFGGVPAVGALAVAGTVTATGSLASGHVTVYPTSDSLPTASTLNTTRGGQTIANSIILGLGTEGKISLFSETGTFLLTDVTGYFLA
jgi:hypothetical protein